MMATQRIPPQPDSFRAGDRAAQQAALLRLARDSIRVALATGDQLGFETDDPWLLEPRAVFVTLRTPRQGNAASGAHDPGELRGCIGQIEAERPLFAAVQDAATKAATIDPRFYPVTLGELDALCIEISILSPMRPIHELREIRIGQDGLLITGNRRRGLLLPEVPLDYGWGAAEFVRHLCGKAGLPADAWPGNASLFAFTTESFEECPRG